MTERILFSVRKTQIVRISKEDGAVAAPSFIVRTEGYGGAL